MVIHKKMVDKERGKCFIKPNFWPIIHRYKISKPLLNFYTFKIFREKCNMNQIKSWKFGN